MAEPPVFRNEWVVQINNLTDNNGGENCRANKDAIPRVATALRNMKPEAYIPQFLSIGPYHHSTLDKDIDDSSCAEQNISRAEMFKGKAAARLSQKLSERGKSFDKSILELMEQMRPKIHRFYHLPNISTTTEKEGEEGEQSKNFSLMMAIDSSFLLYFLIGLYVSREQETPVADDRPRPSNRRLSSSSLHDDHMIELGPLQVCVNSDILKLENQIPLTVLNGVFKYAKKASIYRGLPEDLNQLLHKTCATLSSFKFEVSYDEYIKLNGAATVENQPHLLAYMHAFLLPFLQVKLEDQDADLSKFEPEYEISLNARKLAKDGIQFKSISVSDRDKMIRFNSRSSTLYLPPINVTEMQTEVLLRNMLAWEFNDVSRGSAVMRYVCIMDSLIQTPQDVRVLRNCGVIESTTLTDESIAKMWNNLVQPFFTGNSGPQSDDLSRRLYFVLLKNYHESVKIKTTSMFARFYDGVSSKRVTWLLTVYGLGFSAYGLAFTIVQTYYTILQYNSSRG